MRRAYPALKDRACARKHWSAIGNQGTFNPKDPRLTYGAGGLALGATAADQDSDK